MELSTHIHKFKHTYTHNQIVEIFYLITINKKIKADNVFTI